MAFTGNFVCTSFKGELLKGVHDFRSSGGDTFMLALYDSTAAFTAATTAYTSTNEVAGTGGYSTGGGTLAIASSIPATSGTTYWVDFDDETWSASTITAYGALLYNSTPSGASPPTNPTCVVLDFLAAKTSSAGDFTVVFPAADASNAIIRIA